MLGFKALIALQVKASGSLPRKQPQRTAKPTAIYALSAALEKGVVKSEPLKFRGHNTKIQPVMALMQGVVLVSQAVLQDKRVVF